MVQEEPSLDNDTPCKVVLTAEQWNLALSVLREAPYKLVAPLVQQIIAQCMATKLDGASGRN
jgi:hypothetical protein